MAMSTQSACYQHWTFFLDGYEAAFNWPKTFILFYSSPTIQKAMLKLFVFNGLGFLGTLVFLEAFYSSPAHKLFGCPYTTLVGYPMYFALLAVNGKFYSKVAEKSFQVQNKGHASGQGGSLSNAEQSMAATIYTAIFYVSCGVFAAILRTLPYAGQFLAFLMSCCIFSYYCFEFRWLYLGWPMDKRASYIEQHWAFFIGFGVPGTVLTFFLSTFRSAAVFALIYPCYTMMAFLATLKPTAYTQTVASGEAARSEWMLPNKIPVFAVVRRMMDLVILIVRFVAGVHAAPILAERNKVGSARNKQE